jgi:adenylate cyclase, class 2
MQIINYEFKAKANNLIELEEKLLTLQPKLIGTDHQIDTYFNVPKGRLKLREGNIENSLIYYERSNDASAKESLGLLYKHLPSNALKPILEKIQGIKVVVDKMRKIYFVENVKFHFDTVVNLGTYIEVEALATDKNITMETLKEQADYYAAFFNIAKDDFIAESYSDLLLKL